MSNVRKVSEIIKTLQEMYNPDDEIIVMWWDKNLDYLEHTVSDITWSNVLKQLDGDIFDIPSGMIWDTISEQIELYYRATKPQ